MFNLVKRHLSEVIHYKDLLFCLSWKEISVRYRQTALGVAWAFFQPLSLMLLFAFIFGFILRVPSQNYPYPIFYYSGLLPWLFFSNSLQYAIPSLVNNQQLVTKIYFPREVLPFSALIAAFIDFLWASLIFIGMLFFYKIKIAPVVLFVVPLLFIQIIFTAAIALFASALNVYYRDVKIALRFFIQLWMFLTPIIYPLSAVPEKFHFLFLLNPMAVIISGYREIILKRNLPNLIHILIGFLVSSVLFFLAYTYFKKVERSFADVI